MRRKVNNSKRSGNRRIFVRQKASIPGSDMRGRGRLHVGQLVFPCAIGRSGISLKKKEGDGVTPLGRIGIVAGMMRSDQFKRVPTKLDILPIGKRDGWCDDPADNSYNQKIELPSTAGHEDLWRDDHLYDVLLILDYNIRPKIKGRGSAIFLHIASPEMSPTEGCVAISRNDMRKILPMLSKGVKVDIR